MKYPEELKQKCIDEYINGMKRKDIVLKYGITENSIFRWLRKYNVPKHPKEVIEFVPTSSRKERNRLVRYDRTNGKSLGYLAKKYGINKPTVRVICKDIKDNTTDMIIPKRMKSETIWERQITENKVRKAYIKKLKSEIVKGGKFQFRVIVDRHYENITLDVKQVTDSIICGIDQHGRNASIMWSDLFCRRAKVVA